MISQVISTIGAAVTIKDPKEVNLGPFHCLRFTFRFCEVQNDGDTILVVFAHDALIRVGSVRLYHANFL